jgi:glucose-6-phosphate 1-dehydrogenase
VVVGASGDLAKKKTYPSLLYLFQDNLLPANTVIWGYARSAKSHQELRDHLYPHLIKTKAPEIVVQEFLAKCFYHSGKSYGDEKAYTEMIQKIANYEAKTTSAACNRLFYLAIPPNVFGETGIAIKSTGMATTGWTRVIIEKPFGRDLASCQKLLQTLRKDFEEHHIYRIDHYLGKEVVQNIMLFRFGNSWLEHLWSKDAIQSVTISFKEPFGTEGRGGYFDNYGIIRDILQNHLLQILALVAMEPPLGDDGDAIRNAKTQVLKNMDPISLDNVLLGQYIGYNGKWLHTQRSSPSKVSTNLITHPVAQRIRLLKTRTPTAPPIAPCDVRSIHLDGKAFLLFFKLVRLWTNNYVKFGFVSSHPRPCMPYRLKPRSSKPTSWSCDCSQIPLWK